MENDGFMRFDGGFMVILWDVPSGLKFVCFFNGIDNGLYGNYYHSHGLWD